MLSVLHLLMYLHYCLLTTSLQINTYSRKYGSVYINLSNKNKKQTNNIYDKNSILRHFCPKTTLICFEKEFRFLFPMVLLTRVSSFCSAVIPNMPSETPFQKKKKTKNKKQTTPKSKENHKGS